MSIIQLVLSAGRIQCEGIHKPLLKLKDETGVTQGFQAAEGALEAQLPIYWVPVLKSLYNFLLSGTQGPTIWVPGLLGVV